MMSPVTIVDFSDLYEQRVDDVYGYLAYRTRSQAAAEALTQETFDRAMRASDRFDFSRKSAGVWLLTIARSVYVETRRRRGIGVQIDRPHVGDVKGGEAAGDGSWFDPVVAAAIRQLERREREAIALRFGADLRSAEIAEVLGTSVSNSQQMLSRALRHCGMRLDDGAAA